jgi:hypothetical protein
MIMVVRQMIVWCRARKRGVRNRVGIGVRRERSRKLLRGGGMGRFERMFTRGGM